MMEGGTAHGWNRSTDQLMCPRVPPAPVYKGARGEAAGEEEGTGSRTHLFLVGVGEGKEGREEKEKGGAAPLLVQFRLEGEGRAAALAAPPLLPLRPMRPN